MRADGLLSLEAQFPYGSTYASTENGRQLQKRFPKTVGQYSRQTEFIARTLGPKNVGELEQIATALYMIRNRPGDMVSIAKTINEIKPHVSISDAKWAIGQVEKIIEELEHLNRS